MRTVYTLRGRQVLTLVCFVWAAIFAAAGLVLAQVIGWPAVQANLMASIGTPLIEGEILRPDMLRPALAASLASVGTGLALLYVAMRYVATDVEDPHLDRLPAEYALLPMAALLPVVIWAFAGAPDQTRAWYVLGILGLGFLLSVATVAVTMAFLSRPPPATDLDDDVRPVDIRSAGRRH